MANLFPVGIGNGGEGTTVIVPIDGEIEASVSVDSIIATITQDEITYEITDNPE